MILSETSNGLVVNWASSSHKAESHRQVPPSIFLMEISEPEQGLRFGVEDNDVIVLRELTSPVGKPTGINFPASGGFAQFMRPTTGTTGDLVLNINQTSGTAVIPALKTALSVAEMTPSDFAIQMVKAPERQSFVVGSS